MYNTLTIAKYMKNHLAYSLILCKILHEMLYLD